MVPVGLYQSVYKPLPEFSSASYSLIAIFNEVPSLTQLSTLAIIYNFHVRNPGFIACCVSSHRFKTTIPIDVPTIIRPHKRTHVRYQGRTYSRNYFVLSGPNGLAYIGDVFNARDIQLQLLKSIDPSRPINTYFVHPYDYRLGIIESLRHSQGKIHEIDSFKEWPLNQVIRSFPVVSFVNGDCNECYSSSLAPDITNVTIHETEAPCLIFSAFTDLGSLKKFASNRAHYKIFIDFQDIFKVADKIVGGRNSAIVLRRSELLGEDDDRL